jgi:hypothetical protein
MALRKKALRTAVATAVESLEERRMLSLTITNPDAVPGLGNRLFFNAIGTINANYPAQAQNIHNSQPLILTNSGSSAAVISSIATTGPFSVTLASGASPNGSTIAAGASLTLTVNFTQTTVPPHSANETNYDTNTNGGASITGTLTVNYADPNTESQTIPLAGYYQNNSEDNDEPDLSSIVNTLAGFDTTLITSAQQSAAPESSHPTDFVNNASTANYYGQEVLSNAWTAANSSLPVTITYLANFRTIGNTVDTYWYNSNGTSSAGTSHLLFNTNADEGQEVLPSATVGGAPISASFTPNGPFGFRVDQDEYSYDAINTAEGNSGGGGHHFRFYPLINSSGQAVPNTWIVAMDYAVIQSENFDFQDNVYIVTNMAPTSAPPAPTGLTSTSTATPTLSFTGVNYTAGTLAGYNVYRATSAAGPYTKLTSTPISATSYTDTNAPTGVTLYYQVTAVSTGAAPNESAPATTTANTPAGPYAGSFSVSAFTGQATPIDVLSHDSDTAGTLLPSSITVSNFSAGGSATAPNSSSGVFYYTSAANFQGTETFTYTVTDSGGHTSAPGTVTVAVTQQTVATSTAANDSAVTTASTPVSIDVLANDAVATGASFNLSTEAVSTASAHGTTAVNSDGTITYTPNANYVGADSFVYTIKDSNNHSISATVSLNVGVALTPGTGAVAVKQVKYTDANGTAVTVALNRGVGDLYFSGSGTAGAPVRGVVTVSGGVAISNLALTQTTTASVLTIAGARNGVVELGGITDPNSMGVISAKTAAFIGTIDLAGGTRQLVLGSAGDASSATPYPIILGPTSTFPALTSLVQNDIVQVNGLVQDTSLTSTVTLGTLKTAGWINSVQDVSTNITAPIINNLLINGAMQASLTVDGGAAFSLGTAHVTGATSGGYWLVTGGARTISLGSVTAGWGGADLTGALNTLSVAAGGLPADIAAASFTTIGIHGNLSGNITAGTGRTVSVTGAITSSLITLSAGSLNTLNAVGGISSSIISATGTLGTIAAKAGITGSTLSATGSIHTISAPGGINATGIATGTLTTVSAPSGITASTITTTGSIGTLSAPAGITTSTIHAAGNITTLAASLLSGDTITAGVTASGVTLSNVTASTIGAGTIQNLHVTGRGTAAFADTTVIAHTITSGALGSVAESNGGATDGVALSFTRSLSATENGTIVRLTTATTASPPAFGDFEIRLVTA